MLLLHASGVLVISLFQVHTVGLLHQRFPRLQNPPVEFAFAVEGYRAHGGVQSNAFNGGIGTLYLLNKISGGQQLGFNNLGRTNSPSTPLWFGARNDTTDDPATFTFQLETNGASPSYLLYFNILLLKYTQITPQTISFEGLSGSNLLLVIIAASIKFH